MAQRRVGAFSFWTAMPGIFTSTNNTPTISGDLMTCGGETYGKMVIDAQGTWIVNTRVKINTTGANCDFLSFVSAGSLQCSLVIKSNNKLQLYRGGRSGTAVGAESSVSLTTGIDYDIEIKVVLGDSGSVVVKVAGAEVINSTSIDNTNAGTSTADEIQFGPNGSQGNVTFTHFVIMDSSGSEMNDFIGPVLVNLHKPSGAGNYSQFTPSAGSNYQNVDDAAPDSDSTYNASGTLNQIDTYAMENCPAGVTSVKGVALWWNAKRDDATTRGLSPVWRISATDYVGTEQNVTGSYAYFTQNYALSPATSAAWTSGEVDGAEAGVKVTT